MNTKKSTMTTEEFLTSRGFVLERMEAEHILSQYPDIKMVEIKGLFYPVIIEELGQVRFIKPSKGKDFSLPFVIEKSVSVGYIYNGEYVQPDGCSGIEIYGLDGYNEEVEVKDTDEKYIVIKSKDVANLAKLVNEKIDDYVPIGGICSDGDLFYQSMASKDFYMRDLVKQDKGE